MDTDEPMSLKARASHSRGMWLAMCVVATACAGPTELSPRESAPATVPAPGARPVIVVVVDTLRADHLGIHGYGRRTTSNLDAWASQGRVYERAFATAPWTLPSFGSIYTGLWPAVHRAGTLGERRWLSGSSPNRLSASVETLAEVLRDRGFETGAVMNNPFLEASFGVDRGFNVYDHVPGDNQNVRRADEMVERALDLIDS